MAAKSTRMALVGVLAAALAGCISFGAEPPPSLLTLTSISSAPVGTGAVGTSGSSIAVIEPGAPQSLNVTRVPVRIDDSNIAYLKDAVWVEKPARLFQRLLAETIRSRTNRVVTDGEDPALATTSQIGGTLREFGYDAGNGSVVMRFDAIRQGAGDAVQTRRFESVVPGVAAEAGPVGAALNRAANDVAGQIAEWVSAG